MILMLNSLFIMDALYFGNIGAGEIIIIVLLVVLPIALLLRAVIRWLDRH
jgi:hypothetical protein